MDIVVRPGQVWGDGNPQTGLGRELVVQHVDERYAYCIDSEGRRTRILKRRMRPRKNGYFLRSESPAHYVEVLSETREGVKHWVWTGDFASPPHCTCEDFHFAEREPGVMYLCKHLRKILRGDV